MADGDAELRERYQRLRELMAAGGPLDVDGPYSTLGDEALYDRRLQAWSPERSALHFRIRDEIVQEAVDAGVPAQGRAVLLGGLPGSGKGAILHARVLGEATHLVIDPDDVKARLLAVLETEGRLSRPRDERCADLRPMEMMQLVHREASFIARQVAIEARDRHLNVVIDRTMGDEQDTRSVVTALRGSGYQEVEAVFVLAPVEQSQGQAVERYVAAQREQAGLGGRPVPDSVWTAAPAPVFVGLAAAGPERGGFDRATLIDNTDRPVGPDQKPGVPGVVWEPGVPPTILDETAAAHLKQVAPAFELAPSPRGQEAAETTPEVDRLQARLSALTSKGDDITMSELEEKEDLQRAMAPRPGPEAAPGASAPGPEPPSPQLRPDLQQ